VNKNAEAAAQIPTHLIFETTSQEVANGFDSLCKNINLFSNVSPKAIVLKTSLWTFERGFGVKLPFLGFRYWYDKMSCFGKIAEEREMMRVVMGIDLVVCIEKGLLGYEEALLSRILENLHVHFSVEVLKVEDDSE
jgi:hypothetical protein